MAKTEFFSGQTGTMAQSSLNTPTVCHGSIIIHQGRGVGLQCLDKSQGHEVAVQPHLNDVLISRPGKQNCPINCLLSVLPTLDIRFYTSDSRHPDLLTIHDPELHRNSGNTRNQTIQGLG